MTETATTTAGLDLTTAFRQLWRFPSAWILFPAVTAAWVARLAAGRWTWPDLLVPAVVLALEPFTEWNIHVFLLHWRPRRVLGHTVDPYVAKKHRAHHRDPKDLPLVFIPLRILIVDLAISAPLFWLIMPTVQLALMTIASTWSMLLLYEWTHYLIHTNYRPRTRAYRYVWRAHRLHHYRNERYWFGVTVHLADHVLGTFPDKDRVPVSETARTLGVREAA